MNTQEMNKARELKEVARELGKTTDPAVIKNLREKAIQLIADLMAPEALSAVKSIEASFMTTKDHYGQYMGILGNMKGIYRLGFIRALINAGAGNGLTEAVKILSSIN